MTDLFPKNRDHSKLENFDKNINLQTSNERDEKVEIYGGTDHVCVTAGGAGDGCFRGMSKDGDQ